MICRYFVCVPKWRANINHQNESIATQVTHEDTHLCTTLQIQINEGDLYLENDVFVDASDFLI
jgi:hypothetical protein